MADNFKLPGSSYEEIIKIIKAYSSGKEGQAQPLDAIAQASCPGSDEAVAGKGNRGLYDEWRQGGSGSLLGRESRHQALPE